LLSLFSLIILLDFADKSTFFATSVLPLKRPSKSSRLEIVEQLDGPKQAHSIPAGLADLPIQRLSDPTPAARAAQHFAGSNHPVVGGGT
jgi:hypothetical protein